MLLALSSACGGEYQADDAAFGDGAATVVDGGSRTDSSARADSVSGSDLTQPDSLAFVDADSYHDVFTADATTLFDSSSQPDSIIDDVRTDDHSAHDANVDDARVGDLRLTDLASNDHFFSEAGVGTDASAAEAGQHMCAMGLPAQLVELTAEQLHTALVDKDFLLINVADATGNQIPGTDTCIAHDDTDALVAYIGADQSVKVVLYCNTSNRSGIAGNALVALGYCNVSHLLGGRNAWSAAGFPFE